MNASPPGPEIRPVLIYPWLLLLLGPAIQVVQGDLHPAWLLGGGLLLFIPTFLITVHLAQVRPAAVGALVALAALTVALTLVGGEPMVKASYLLAMAAGVVFAAGSEWLGPLVVLIIATAGTAIAWLAGAGDEFSIWYVTLLSGLVVTGFLRLVATVNELREARNELARAAVAEERLRFARDLHDLLGHTLSVIVVKAEAVRRLHERAPELVPEQASDIEAIGRQALAEVREAVTGYRRTTLNDELATAQTALEDAGIEVTVHQPRSPLPPRAELLLGWAVREGTTNVLRHSGAAHCEIRIAPDGDAIVLQIEDDGTGCAGTTAGNGLRGLSERMALADGTAELTSAAAAGSRLTVRLPFSTGLDKQRELR